MFGRHHNWMLKPKYKPNSLISNFSRTPWPTVLSNQHHNCVTHTSCSCDPSGMGNISRMMSLDLNYQKKNIFYMSAIGLQVHPLNNWCFVEFGMLRLLGTNLDFGASGTVKHSATFMWIQTHVRRQTDTNTKQYDGRFYRLPASVPLSSCLCLWDIQVGLTAQRFWKLP